MNWFATFLASVSFAAAQNAVTARRPEFEVASVKRNTSGSAGEKIHITPGGRLAIENMPVRILIQNAYSLTSFQIAGAPGWIDSERYDVTAKSGGQGAPDELFLMLRTLLEDRLRLKTHRQTRQESVFLLMVGKGGAKIQRAEGTCVPRDPKKPPPRPQPGEQPPNYCWSMRRSRENLDGIGVPLSDNNGFTLSTLCGQLSSILGRAVLDGTDLSGIFNFQLRWTPDADPSSGGVPLASADAPAPSIFTALQEQLGLKLESGRGPVEMLVIDHIERPDPN